VTIEEAIRSALEFETRVRDTYAAAVDKVGPPGARSFFEVMVREEQGHIDYLRYREQEWRKAGILTAEPLPSALASEGWARKASEGMEGDAGGDARTSVVEHLYAALRLEELVSDHYRELVAGVEHPEAEAMFSHFLEIEDGHIAMVQAEIDFQSGTGIYYDMQEFTLDG
jgi:rubrerythrin